MTLSLENLLDAFGVQPGNPGTQSPPQSTAVDPITVSAPVAKPDNTPPPNPISPVPQTNTDFSRSVYNNIPDVEMARQGQQAYPQHTGAFGVHGTLRSVLGVLGDSLLISHGLKPVYGPRIQEEKEADAMAGFASDPRAAAARLAALPGAADDATKVYNSYEQYRLRTQQQQSNDDYRKAREDALADQEKSRQDLRDARMRQGIGGVLTAAATPDPKTGVVDPQRWAAARAQALKFGSKISDFDPSEVPDTADQYNAGYGQTARQVAQGQTSNASIQERSNAASQTHADRVRGQDISAQGAAAHNATTQRDTDVRDATARRGQDMRGSKLHIPGLTPNTAPSGGPTPSDIQYLKNNPHLRAQFDAHFGNGASGKYLGN